jgi:hypothetical protein
MGTLLLDICNYASDVSSHPNTMLTVKLDYSQAGRDLYKTVVRLKPVTRNQRKKRCTKPPSKKLRVRAGPGYPSITLAKEHIKIFYTGTTVHI